MKPIIRLTSLLACLSLIASCASVKLDHENLKNNKIGNIEFRAVNLRFEQSTSAATGGAGGFGLLGLAIGAGIDASANKKRNSSFQPILNALGDFDPNPILEENLKKIKGISFSPEIILSQYNTDKNTTEIKPKILYVVSNYVLAPNLKSISAIVFIRYKPENESEIYSHLFKASEALTFPSDDYTKDQVTNYLVNNTNIIKDSIASLSENLVLEVENHFNIPPKK